MPWAEQLPSGKYRALYRDRDGKRRSAGTFDHKKRAESAAAVAEADARKLGWRDPDAGSRPWGDWAAAWWPTRPVEAGTLHRDSYRLEKYLTPRWATIPLAEISRFDVKQWATELGRNLAPASVQRILYLFSASLNAAIDAELLTTNPAFRIKIAKGETSSERYLAHNEFELVLEQLPTQFDRAVASLLTGTGVRWGEAAGLQIKRVDFDRGIIRVAETWDDDMGQLKPWPKGKKIRTVPVPEWVMEELVELKGDRRTGLLMAKSTGKPPSLSNWRSRIWAPAVARAEIGHTRVHDLRHTCASWLIQDGWTLAEVGAHLGHRSPQTTQIYAHLLPSDRTRVTSAIPRPRRGANVGQPVATPGYAKLRSITPRTAESQAL